MDRTLESRPLSTKTAVFMDRILSVRHALPDPIYIDDFEVKNDRETG